MNFNLYIRAIAILWQLGVIDGFVAQSLLINSFSHYGITSFMSLENSNNSVPIILESLVQPINGLVLASQYVTSAKTPLMKLTRLCVVTSGLTATGLSVLLGSPADSVATGAYVNFIIKHMKSIMLENEEFKTFCVLTALKRGLSIRGGCSSACQGSLLLKELKPELGEIEKFIKLPVDNIPLNIAEVVNQPLTLKDLEHPLVLANKTINLFRENSIVVEQLYQQRQALKLKDRFIPIELQLINNPSKVRNYTQAPMKWKASFLDINRSPVKEVSAVVEINCETMQQELTTLEILRYYSKNIASIFIVGAAIVVFFRKNRTAKKCIRRLRNLYRQYNTFMNRNWLTYRFNIISKDCFKYLLTAGLRKN